MGLLSRLRDIDGDEVSLVKRGANRRRYALLKEDSPVEFDDMISVPVEYEGALTDHLRKEGIDETVIEATVGGLRLLKAASDDLPDEAREAVEKLGSQMYPITNKDLNNMDGADKPNSGTNGPADKADQAPPEGDGDEPDEDEDDGIDKAEFNADERKRLAGTGAAMSDGSYPIRNRDDLQNAIQAFGRAKNPAKVKAHIKSRAQSLGATSLLPDSWGGGGSNVNKEGTMSEGASAVPVPIRKDDGTWDLSGVPDESRPFFETVLKAQDDIAKERDALAERVEKAEEQVTEERNQRLEREFIAKAEGFTHIAKADDLGPVLKEISDKISAESFEVLEKALASAEERIAKGDLFKELGRSGAAAAGEDSPGDAWAQIEKMAGEMVEKDSDISQAQAIDKVLKTAKGAELYGQYLVEARG